MIKGFLTNYYGDTTGIALNLVLRDSTHVYDTAILMPLGVNSSTAKAALLANLTNINAWLPTQGLPALDELVDLTLTNPQKFFKANVAGGAGNVTFATVDASGNALYPNLTADQLSFFVDGVADQYAFPTITVASDKKSVTVNVQKQSFSTGLAGLVNVLIGVSYANAANGIGVKMVIGIDD